MKEIDLTKLDKTGLRNLLKNARDKGADDLARRVVKELAARGLAERRDYDVFEWNQDRVQTVLAPFKEISLAVANNKRTAYTEAGGLKIGRSKDDPLWKWIDSYSAIKTPNVNAVFVCYVEKPGDQPYFKLLMDGHEADHFTTDEVERGLQRWREIATLA